MKDFNVFNQVIEATLESYPETFWADSVKAQEVLLNRVKKGFKKQETESVVQWDILGDLLAILALNTERTKEIIFVSMTDWLREIIGAISPKCYHERPTEAETFLRYRKVDGLLVQASSIETGWVYPLVQLVYVEIQFIKENEEYKRTDYARAS